MPPNEMGLSWESGNSGALIVFAHQDITLFALGVREGSYICCI